jgi:hypothetical protein
LQAAINEAATLSPEAQEELAAQIESWLADGRWDALLEDPRGDAFVAEFFEQAQKGPFRPFPTPADMGDEEEGVG